MYHLSVLSIYSVLIWHLKSNFISCNRISCSKTAINFKSWYIQESFLLDWDTHHHMPSCCVCLLLKGEKEKATLLCGSALCVYKIHVKKFSGCYIYKTNWLPLRMLEDEILKDLCADENGIIIFELPLLTSMTPTADKPVVISSHESPCGL